MQNDENDAKYWINSQVNEAFMVNPYHLNSLLIRANTAFMQEDVTVAMELLCEQFID